MSQISYGCNHFNRSDFLKQYMYISAPEKIYFRPTFSIYLLSSAHSITVLSSFPCPSYIWEALQMRFSGNKMN